MEVQIKGLFRIGYVIEGTAWTRKYKDLGLFVVAGEREREDEDFIP